MVKSSIGRKAIVAITGAGLFGFVIAHMLGNLQIFLGRETLNAYAAFLKSTPELLWTARLGLLAFFVAHIVVAITLARENMAARPQRYAMEDTVAASTESMYMVRTGLVILAFVVYHLMHFTFFAFNKNFASLMETMPDGSHRHDVFSMVVLGFRNPAVSTVYILAQVLLAMHLSHGASSMFQTLGINSKQWRPTIAKIGPTAALIILIGNVSMPLAVLVGVIRLPAGLE